MSLWFDLCVNDHAIGHLAIRRLEHLDLWDPGVMDAVSTYKVTRDGQELGTVRHRYGDGAWALVRLALALEAPGERKARQREGLPSAGHDRFRL